MVAGHLAGLQRFHLLWRNQCIEFHLPLLLDLPNPLLTLLRAEGRVSANRLDFGVRPLLDEAALLHSRLGDACFFPAGRLVRMRRTGDHAGMPR